MRKVERSCKGYEDMKIYNELEAGDKFFVRLKQVDNNDEITINDIKKEMCLVYDKRVLFEKKKQLEKAKELQRKKEQEVINRKKEYYLLKNIGKRLY